jgi:hypothetical protein
MDISETLLDLNKTIAEKGGLDNYIKEVVKATNNTNGFSTRQSLSQQVADLTVRRTPLFDMLPRETVINPIHQWDAITAISNIASFAGPIDSVGNDADPTITRYSEPVRYYRTTTTVGQFTQAMSRPELQAQQTVDEKAIAAICYDIEGDLFAGGAGADNIRGLGSIISSFSPASHTVSNASAALTATTTHDSVMTAMIEDGSLATHFWMNGSDKTAWRDIFNTVVRYMPTVQKNKYGYAVEQYVGAFGEVDIMFDFFVPAKAGTTPVSTSYITDMTVLALGEPVVNGASGIAMQDLARTGPQNVKLINYYGLLIYRNVNGLGRVTDIA